MKAAEVVLTSEERATLRSWRVSGKTERRMAFRAAVILAVAEGLSNEAVAVRLGTRPATVSKWRGRFARDGLPGLADAPRSGKPPHYAAEHERRVLATLDEPPPAGYGTLGRNLAGQAFG
jgi:transposase